MSAESHSETQVQTANWPRRLLILFFVLLPFGLLLQVYIYFTIAGSSELKAAIEEADRLDPSWRIEDLEANRIHVPDAENSALLIRLLAKAVPISWPNEEIKRLLVLLPPFRALTADEHEHLRSQWILMEPTIMAGRKLSQLPRGRFPRGPLTDIESAMGLIYDTDVRSVCNLLLTDALYRLETDDVNGSTESALAVLNATRSLRDEPLEGFQLWRVKSRHALFRFMERLLACRSSDEPGLARFQEALAEDAGQNLFLLTSRGERALWENTLRSLQEDLPLKQKFYILYRVGAPKHNRAAVLQYQNRVVEIAKLPTDEQLAEMKKHESAGSLRGFAAELIGPRSSSLQFYLRDQSELHSLIAALAVERFRLKHNRWPDKLNDLVPDFLDKVLDDPFIKAPIRLRKTPDGVVIYSVGANLTDDAGHILRDRKSMGANHDFGFELRDMDKRPDPKTEQKP